MCCLSAGLDSVYWHKDSGGIANSGNSVADFRSEMFHCAAPPRRAAEHRPSDPKTLQLVSQHANPSGSVHDAAVHGIEEERRNGHISFIMVPRLARTEVISGGADRVKISEHRENQNMSAPQIESKFIVNKASETPFVDGGLRVYRAYRDLGIAEATGGRVHAQIIRTTRPCPDGGSGMHYHDLEFQMVMVLKGTSTVWFEGQGEVTFNPGDCWIQPPRIQHNVLYYSDDYEVLEITLPAEYDTVQVDT